MGLAIATIAVLATTAIVSQTIVVNAPVGMAYQQGYMRPSIGNDGRATYRQRQVPGPVVIGNNNQVKVYHVIQLGAINRSYPTDRQAFRFPRRR